MTAVPSSVLPPETSAERFRLALDAFTAAIGRDAVLVGSAVGEYEARFSFLGREAARHRPAT